MQELEKILGEIENNSTEQFGHVRRLSECKIRLSEV